MNNFTVCIPCVDKHITKMEKLLESFEHYTYRPKKVIVSLSPKYLKLCLEAEKLRLEKKFDFLTCLVQKKQTGSGENLNYTFQYVETEYVTVWGADDFFHPQYFEIMNHIIKTYGYSILVHTFDHKLQRITKNKPSLSHDISVFQKIDLKNIKVYDDLILRHESRDIFRFVSRKYTEKNRRSLIPYLHAGMQTFKSSILKEHKYKEGYSYDNRSDTLFLVEIFNKYKNICVIDENLIQYIPNETYK